MKDRERIGLDKGNVGGKGLGQKQGIPEWKICFLKILQCDAGSAIIMT